MKPEAPPAADPNRRRITIVDDHPMMRAGLVQLISKQPDLAVCGEAGSPAEAFRELARSRPDLLVADLTMPGRGGFDFIRDALALHAGLPILIVSMHDETIYAERALRAGARGYIMKEAGGENLLLAIRSVLGGRVYLSPALSSEILEGLSGPKPRALASPISTLSDREFEVFQLIGQGKSTTEIARQLHLSPKTVEAHRGHLKLKLKLKGATALVRYALRWVETETSGP
jgi:DNA-binding NarL/FixJ family response regulator